LSFLLSIFIFAFPTPGGFGLPELTADEAVAAPPAQPPAMAPVPRAALAPVEALLERYDVDKESLERVARAVLRSSRKHDVDPRLVTSIVIVESRANPFAISVSDSIGIMQIHLPTWGETADREGINLFKIEDNVDFGVRILKGYVKRHGVWEGVKRYKGWFPDNPASEQSAVEYVQKIQGIYGYEQSPEPAAVFN
jgi:soluble lytic murein transglycosylase-like protein